MATNEHLKTRLLIEMKKVVKLLGDPHYEWFVPLTIDYDLIEVNGGRCWSLKKTSFFEDAFSDSQMGRVSPTAF